MFFKRVHWERKSFIMVKLLITFFSDPSITSDEVHSPVYQALEPNSADTDKEESSSEEAKETSTVEVVESSDIETQSSQTVPTETTLEETTGDLPSAPAVMTEESKPELASYAEEVEAAIVVNAEADVDKLEDSEEVSAETTEARSLKEDAEEKVIDKATDEVTEAVTETVTETVPQPEEPVPEETDEEPAPEQQSSTSITHSESTEQQLIETQPPQTGKDFINEMYAIMKSVTIERCILILKVINP